MNNAAIIFTTTVLLAGGLAAQQADEPQEGFDHPPVQALPPGHPSMSPPAPGGERPAADPTDVVSADAIVHAYYDVISGGKKEPRDWDRFLALFMPEARFVRAGGAGAAPTMVTPQQFVAANRKYFERGHVFSTYESRRKADDAKPYSRGINSFQLISSGGRWWIVTIMWDHERADGLRIPPELLPPGAVENG